MTNRVASNASINRVATDLARTFTRLSDVQSQITSGKTLQRPSDNPSQVAVALDSRATKRRLEQYAANATDATGWVRITDDTLVGLQEQAAYAKAKLTGAVNGALDATSRNAIANDIDQVKAAMIQMANQTYQGRAIFGGTAVTTTPYDSTGAYAGDSGTVRRTVDDGVTIQVNVIGTDVFGTRDATTPLSGDVFQVLDSMAAAVRSGDATAMSTAATALDSAVGRMNAAQIRVGGASARIENATNRNQVVLADVTERLSSIEDVDLAEAIIALKTNEAAYQAALGATARVIQPSLLDFLR